MKIRMKLITLALSAGIGMSTVGVSVAASDCCVKLCHKEAGSSPKSISKCLSGPGSCYTTGNGYCQIP